MFKKLFAIEKLFPIAVLLIFLSCATTQKQSVVRAESIEEPEITNNLDNSLSDLTTQIINSISEDGKKKIAVIEFSDLEGNVTQFGKYLAEELITRLFRTKKFEVVERQLLNKIISEQKLSITGMIDPNSAKELGRILGVDAIVSGTITDLGTSLKVNARLISTETGTVFGVAATDIVKNDNVKKLMGIISSAQKGEVQKQTEKEEILKEALKKVEVEKFTFEVSKCKMSSGGTVTCDLLVTNNEKEGREISTNCSRSRIIDNYGNQYKPDELIFGGESYRWHSAYGGRSYKDLQETFISGVPTKVILVFKNVSLEARSISVLEFGWLIFPFDTPIGAFKAELHNIPLSK